MASVDIALVMMAVLASFQLVFRATREAAVENCVPLINAKPSFAMSSMAHSLAALNAVPVAWRVLL